MNRDCINVELMQQMLNDYVSYYMSGSLLGIRDLAVSKTEKGTEKRHFHDGRPTANKQTDKGER